MTGDVLARIRVWAAHLESETGASMAMLYTGGYMARMLRQRFPEAFEEQDTLLETDSPEEVALYRLVIGPHRPWELDLTERQRQAMRKMGLMKFAAGRWHITDAGLAEARRHRERP